MSESNKGRHRRSLTIIAAGALALATTVPPVTAQENYAGQQIELIIPFSEGGGSDSYARFIAKFVEKHLPGKPTIIPRNMPGGGSITGTNYFDARAKSDGTMTLVVTPSPLISYLLNPHDKRIQYDPRKWNPVIGSVASRIIYVHKDSGIKTVADVKTLSGKKLSMGFESPTGSDIVSLLALDLLGFNIHAVFGFSGGGPVRLGFERGEFAVNVDAAQGFLTSVQPLVESGTAIPIFTFGILNDKGEFIRDPNFPNLPHFVEAYRAVHGKDPEGPGFEAWKSLFQVAVMSARSIVLPAAAADSVKKTYEAAMRKVLDDPEFKAQADQFLGVYPQLLGEQARVNIQTATSMTDEARTWLREWLVRKYNVKL